ncbi:MAG: TolC family protein [Methylophilaceae bacterium]|nr:TolC family protein [Methylophilaceae bacterium]
MEKYRAIISSMLLPWLAGCAMQAYAPQPLEPEKTTQTFQARTLADAGLGDVSAWGLPELTQVALRLHPELDAARAQWKAARAAELTAGQRPNPAFSASGEHHSRAPGISPWTWTLSIDLPVETHGKREARIDQARALSEAARLEIGQTAWNVRSRLRAQMLAAYAIQQEIAQLRKEAVLRARLVELLEARLTAGLVAGTDLTDARLQLQKTRTALDTATTRLAESRAAIAAAVGVPLSALTGITLSFAAFEHDPMPLPFEQVQRAALLNRLDIRKGLATYEAAEAKLKLEIAKQYPDINLAPGYSWDQGDNRWSLGLSLVFALFNRNEGPIAEARAARDLEAARFQVLQAQVIGEQEQAWARYQAAHEEIRKSQALVETQRARLEQIRRQFDAGYADRVELTGAELELVIAEAGVLAARLAAQRALGQLEDAVQQPLDGSAPLPEIAQTIVQESTHE